MIMLMTRYARPACIGARPMNELRAKALKATKGPQSTELSLSMWRIAHD